MIGRCLRCHIFVTLSNRRPEHAFCQTWVVIKYPHGVFVILGRQDNVSLPYARIPHDLVDIILVELGMVQVRWTLSQNALWRGRHQMAQNHAFCSILRQKRAILRPFARKNLQGTTKSVNLTSRDSEPCPPMRTQLWASEKQLARAERWAQNSSLTLSDEPSCGQIPNYLALAHVYLALGKSLPDVLTLIVVSTTYSEGYV